MSTTKARFTSDLAAKLPVEAILGIPFGQVIHVSEKLSGVLVASKSDLENHFWDITWESWANQEYHLTLASSKQV